MLYDMLMGQVRLFLLGPPQIELNGKPLAINRRKVLALLVYLAMSQRAHQRDHLATLFWPGYDQSSARANLRKTVSLLKQELDEERLEIQREQITLVRGDSFWLDTDQFQNIVNECIPAGHTKSEITAPCLDELIEAAELYRDDFLSGFSLADAPEFTDWQLFQAENYRRRLAQLYETLSQAYADQKEWEQALAFARRWLALDTLEEGAHRQLMRLLASNGQRSAALMQYEQCRSILADELEVEPSAETTALYEEIRQGAFGRTEAPALTPAAPAPAPRINLPPQLTSFVGREQEVAEITRLLVEEPACRHVTLFGPGGVGKTRLAIKTAAEAGHAFSGGAAFVSLASLSHADGLVPAVAEALGLELSGRNSKDRLLNYLHRKELLLILDNFEHLISPKGSGLLSDILLSAPEVKLLVTSRQRLNLGQEWSLEVFGMRLPAITEQEMAVIEQYEAIQLFMGRAQRVRRGFTLSNENHSDVVRICHLVDGMPLGIEMAVAWLRLISAQEIAQEIERSLDFLTSVYPNTPQRHYSLRAVFEYSWQLLSAEEKGLLRRISVFRGGFTDRAAQRVVGATLPLLAALVDKAMLRRTRSRRYEIHELLRQFAAEKLDGDPGEKERTQDQHAEYYLAFVQLQLDDQWLEHTREARKEIIEEFVADIDNIWAAWYHALERGNAALLGKSAEGLQYITQQKGWNQEGVAAFKKAIDEAPDDMDPLILARLLHGHGFLRTWLGDLAQATELLEQSVSLQRGVSAGPDKELAHSLYELSMAYFIQGKWGRAKKYARESLALSTKSRDRYQIGLSTQMLGYVATYTGNYKQGVELLEESIGLLQLGESGLDYRGVYSKLFLGVIARLQGEFEKAKSIFEGLLQVLRDEGNPLDIGYSLRELGYLNISLGDYAQAKLHMAKGLEIFKAIGARAVYLLVATGLGDIERLMGNYGQAERLHREGLSIAREIGERRGIAICLDNLGRLAFAKADYKAAEELFLESLSMHESIGHTHGQATVLCHLGINALSLGVDRFGEAERCLRQALSISSEIGATPLILEVLRGFALLWTTREAGDTDQAKTLEHLSLILNHPASEQETKDHARRLWDKLTAELPAESMTSAMNWVPSSELERIANEIRSTPPSG